jgi:hypothetical protein
MNPSTQHDCHPFAIVHFHWCFFLLGPVKDPGVQAWYVETLIL